jgi:hypothetical protein
MNLNPLPDEIIRHIQKYLYKKCGECKNNVIADLGQLDITTIYYRAIFDDNFPFPRIHKTYDFICNQCIKQLKNEYIKPL